MVLTYHDCDQEILTLGLKYSKTIKPSKVCLTVILCRGGQTVVRGSFRVTAAPDIP